MNEFVYDVDEVVSMLVEPIERFRESDIWDDEIFQYIGQSGIITRRTDYHKRNVYLVDFEGHRRWMEEFWIKPYHHIDVSDDDKHRINDFLEEW